MNLGKEKEEKVMNMLAMYYRMSMDYMTGLMDKC